MTSWTNLFGFKQIEADSGLDPTLIVEEINKGLEEYLLGKTINTDSTDGIFDFLEKLTNRVQEDFAELIGQNTDKKQFMKALTCILALLINTKVTTLTKIKRILKIAVETTLKIWQGQK